MDLGEFWILNFLIRDLQPVKSIQTFPNQKKPPKQQQKATSQNLKHFWYQAFWIRDVGMFNHPYMPGHVIVSGETDI